MGEGTVNEVNMWLNILQILCTLGLVPIAKIVMASWERVSMHKLDVLGQKMDTNTQITTDAAANAQALGEVLTEAHDQLSPEDWRIRARSISRQIAQQVNGATNGESSIPHSDRT